MKKIGISACFFYPDVSRTVFGHKTITYLEKDMSVYLTRKGILPVLLPDVDDDILETLVGEMDGIVFQGGSDMAPESYGEAPIGKWKGDRHRDLYELKIMAMAMKMEKPIFGICRGFQVMNVFFGGTLYQDILSQKASTYDHRSAELYDRIHHGVSFTQGSWMEKLYQGIDDPQINTVHHQAVKDLGQDLEVLATSTEDGIIEAFQYSKAPDGKVIGVQWHPEFFHTIKEKLVDAEALYDEWLKHI